MNAGRAIVPAKGKEARVETDMPLVGRLAPSPTGRMHAGNIYAALMAWLVAKSTGGRVVLRIEDLDRQRSKPEYIDQVQRDFELLGLTWDEGPFFQSDRTEAYESAYKVLQDKGLLYPCFCSRADLHAASAPHKGEKPIYAGTCRTLTTDERRARAAQKAPSVRVTVPHRLISIDDQLQGAYSEVLDKDCGDFIVRRSDGSFAYQLAVVVDDAACGVNSVVRGVDLLSSTPQQVFLQQELDLPTPAYCHVPLLVAEDGRRLSKRNQDASLEALLTSYKTPEGVLGHIAWLGRLQGSDEPTTPESLLSRFSLNAYRRTIGHTETIVWR